ncbi:MAG: efflux RND transporter periplasmic adaptor subunit [Candidatus Shapirobacteria bacterium]|nr:efflux RND transporter periplasmic adaptor subunit [Candidatus Shapirobacteria bacterium]MDD4410142.1 efflux RND transporter periplasmic adaptor subunit [Candidatus Shapirobacteria bacterium]
MKLIKKIKDKFLSLPKLLRIILIILVVLGITWFIYSRVIASSKKITYKTTEVAKGTLITSISATGTITSSNKTIITTGATGTIKKVYVKNGDTITKNQKIAEVTLDEAGVNNQTTAWANYLTMQQNQKAAIADRTAADLKMWQDRQAILDAQTEYNNMVAGAWNPKTKAEYTYNEKAIVTKTLELAKQTFTVDETEYNNSTAFVAKAQQQASEAYENYKKVSSTIYAPISGIISNLSLATGVIISNTSNSITVSTGTNSSQNSSTVTSHTVGSITNPKGQYQATLSLTESDIVKIKAGQKVTMTMDAFSGITFTGKVLSVDVAGATTSGVTSYSVVVLLDDTDKEIYANMAVSATIIINSKADILLIPSTAIDTAADGTVTVRTIKDNITSTVTITIGETNDSETEVTSGLNEGDTIISSSVSAQSKSNNNTTSSFGSSTTNKSGGSFNMGGPPGGF